MLVVTNREEVDTEHDTCTPTGEYERRFDAPDCGTVYCDRDATELLDFLLGNCGEAFTAAAGNLNADGSDYGTCGADGTFSA